MELFTLDLGNKQAKIMSRKALKVFPSYFIDVDEYGKRDVLGVSKLTTKTTSDYKSLNDPDMTYVWGPGLDVKMKNVTETIGFSNRYDSLEFQLLTDFALAELAKDFESANKFYIDVCVVTGVPTDDYDKPQVIEQITKTIKGVHNVVIDGKTYTVNVHDVFVSRQTVGTAIDVMVDDNLEIIEDNDVENGYIGIVDCGGGTILIDAFENMNLDVRNRRQLEDGSHTLFTDIRNKMVEKNLKITDHEVEQLLRNGDENKGYFWSENGNQIHDVTGIVMKQRRLYTRRLAQSVKSTYKKLGNMKRIYVTGGTANLLLQREFINNIPIAVFVKDSETATVRGYYKWGLINEVTNDGEREE